MVYPYLIRSVAKASLALQKDTISYSAAPAAAGPPAAATAAVVAVCCRTHSSSTWAVAYVGLARLSLSLFDTLT